MKKLMLICTILAGFWSNVFSVENIGLRLAAGADITGGIAFGIGANFLTELNDRDVELGAVIFSGSFKETSSEYYNTYTETTDIFVLGLLANFLFNYYPNSSNFYYLTGVGLGYISVEWEEKSPTDTSLGTYLPGGGSMQSEDGQTIGSILNLGIGKTLNNGVDIRLELPFIVSFNGVAEAATIIPTLMISAGLRL